jgi:predicted metal-dependent HD superfamily phosphohydrolase
MRPSKCQRGSSISTVTAPYDHTMSSPEVELRAVWHQLTSPAARHEILFEGLLARHREPHRRYHTATHVMWVVRHVRHLLAASPDPSPDAALDDAVAGVDADAVLLAALFHDAVYDPTRADNEAASAALAVRAADALGWSEERQATVARLVFATAGHAPTAPDETLLVDADLAILGAEPKDYAAYVQGVRVEYRHVPEDQWRIGRAAVLQRFLDATPLFHTEVMHRERESRAKANLAAELASVRA